MAPLGLSMVRPEAFGRALLPENFRQNIERKLLMAGVRREPYFFFGTYFYILIAFMVFFYITEGLPRITGATIQFAPLTKSIWLFALTTLFAATFLGITTLISWYIFQYFLTTRTYQRTKAVESVLEDYLRYVGENLRGGMSFQQALWNSVKPEFGVLAEEIQIVTKKVITGTQLEVALREFTNRYDSPMLQRTFDIIAEALEGGGRITLILDDIIENLSGLKELKQEMVTTNLSYSIFINAIVIFITPLLFALSTQFIFVLDRIGSSVGPALANTQSAGLSGLGSLNFSGASLGIEPFMNFATGVLVVNSLGAAVLSAIMNKGDWKQGGVSYLIYPAISVAIYYVIARAAQSLFGSFVPI